MKFAFFLLIFFLTLFFTPSVWAGQSADVFSAENFQVLDSLNYVQDGTHLDFQDRLKLSAILSEELGMTPILQQSDRELTFVSYDLKKLVILKSGLTLSEAGHENEVLKTHAGSVFHAKSHFGGSFALFFSGVSGGAIQSIVSKVKEQLVSGNYDFRSHAPALFALARQLWITDVQADCQLGISNQDLWDQVAAVQSSKNLVLNSETINILKGVGSCLKKGGKGVYDGSIGAVVDVGKALYHGGKNYLEHVMQDGDVYLALADSAGDFWDSASSEVRQIVSTVKLLTLQGGFSSLSMQDKVDLTCQIAGTALPAIIVTLASGGAASESILGAFRAIIKALIKALPRLARVIEGIASVIEVVGKSPKERQLLDFQKKVADFVKEGRVLSPEELDYIRTKNHVIAEIRNKAGQIVAVETKEQGIMTSVVKAAGSATAFSEKNLAVYRTAQFVTKSGKKINDIVNEVKGPAGEIIALEMSDGRTLAQIGENVKLIRPFTFEEVSELERTQKVIRKVYNSAGKVIGVETAEAGLVVRAPNFLRILVNPFADNSVNLVYSFLNDSFGWKI